MSIRDAENRALLVLRIDDDSDIPVVLVRLGAFLSAQGICASESARIATATVELATNIAKYAKSGIIRVRALRLGNQRGIEVEAEDKGPGIANVNLALTDSYSTSGSLGLGLPGVRRLMDDFDIRSTLGGGTTVRVRRWLA
jgi:serine/threonine-protein kinase RsbT